MNPRRNMIIELLSIATYLYFTLDSRDKRFVEATLLRGTAHIAGQAAAALGRLAIHTEAKAQQVIRP